jgi:hypothetical protein
MDMRRLSRYPRGQIDVTEIIKTTQYSHAMDRAAPHASNDRIGAIALDQEPAPDVAGLGGI